LRYSRDRSTAPGIDHEHAAAGIVIDEQVLASLGLADDEAYALTHR
jgi:hypothetical protein